MNEKTEIVVRGQAEIILTIKQMDTYKECLRHVREEIKDNPYIAEAIKVLPVGGFRSAIGSFWNAVVDDLRNKITFRSLSLFNKEIKMGREIKTYDDFQNYVNDDQLIDGAYRIGVIGWEANKVLKHAKETRHIFDGHPYSSNPSPIKVLAMMEDCIKYVLSQEYPTQIIDIDDYINILGTIDFDRNEYSVANALSDLPEIYKSELTNRLYTSYIHLDCSSILRSNIEFIAPILWRLLPKQVMIQVSRRIDQEIIKGNAVITRFAFSFIDVVGGTKYVSLKAKTYLVKPLIDRLNDSLDEWSIENECVKELEGYAGYIPDELIDDYVNSLTQTYVGHIGSSANFSRKDFYADGASLRIPKMFGKFDDSSAEAFINVIKNNKTLRSRINYSVKMRRLRSLGNIVLERVSERFQDRPLLELLVDETKEKKFFSMLNK